MRSTAACSAASRSTTTRSCAILRTSDDPAERREAWEASKTIGAVVADDVRELGSPAQRGSALARLPRLVRALARHERARRGAPVRDPGRGRCCHGRAVRALEGRARRDASRSASVAPPASCARGTTTIRSSRSCPSTAASTSIPCSPSRDPVEVSRAARTTGIGLDVGGDPRAQRPVPARRRSPSTRSASTWTARATCACSRNVESNTYWTDTMLHELGHGMLRRRHRRLAALAPAHHPPDPERGHRDALRAARAGSRVAQASRRPGRGASSSRIADRLPAAQAAALLVFARWVLVVTTFEHGLYADPEADHDSRWWELVRRFQLVTPPGRPTCARLGREDPPRRRAGLLPELPLRRDDRVTAARGARAGVPAGSSSGRRRARCSPSGCFARARRCAGTG